jgi:spermidine synthase
VPDVGSTGPVEGTYDVDTGKARLVRDRSDPALWTLYVNGMASSPVHLEDPTILDFEYMRWMADVVELAAPAPPPHPLDVVHLGGAGCALARAMEAVRPGSRQVVVELDVELARLVRQWFDLPRSPRLRLQTGDARQGLARRRDASADVVVRDVFDDDLTPRHLTTLEFVADAARVLRVGGIYLANVADSATLTVLRAEVATLREVFPSTAMVAEPAALRRRRWANAVLVGSASALPVEALVRRMSSGAVPARVVHGEALTDFCAGTRPFRDPVGSTERPGSRGQGLGQSEAREQADVEEGDDVRDPFRP